MYVCTTVNKMIHTWYLIHDTGYIHVPRTTFIFKLNLNIFLPGLPELTVLHTWTYMCVIHTSRHQRVAHPTMNTQADINCCFFQQKGILFLFPGLLIWFSSLFDASSLANLVQLVVPRFAQKMSSFEKLSLIIFFKNLIYFYLLDLHFCVHSPGCNHEAVLFHWMTTWQTQAVSGAIFKCTIKCFQCCTATKRRAVSIGMAECTSVRGDVMCMAGTCTGQVQTSFELKVSENKFNILKEYNLVFSGDLAVSN